MTPFEERLRSDLPALADALLGERPPRSVDDRSRSVAVGPSDRPSRHRAPRRAFLVGAAATAAGAALILGAGRVGSPWPPARLETTGSTAPTGFGSWSSMAPAPIEPRPYAAAAWTGAEVVFWAGSSLGRDFAYVDGAAYDPATDSWEQIAVPGWGHPGLTSAFYRGELYVLAKGGGTRFDPKAGEWHDLPPVEGMFLAATVATDVGIWGLGPTGLNAADQPDLAIARYLPDEDTWVYGPTWHGTDDQASIVAGLSRLESSSLWTGTEIAVCGPTGGCVGFDPVTETWRCIRAASSDSVAVVGPIGTDFGLVMIVQTGDGDSPVAIEALSAQGWQQQTITVPVERFDTVTATTAGDWLVVFAAGQPPTLVHVPSGAWQVAADGPLGGVQAPNAVWTGEQLVVWGGVPDDAASSVGAIWTPPAR